MKLKDKILSFSEENIFKEIYSLFLKKSQGFTKRKSHNYMKSIWVVLMEFVLLDLEALQENLWLLAQI
jgi:hypothetical protein